MNRRIAFAAFSLTALIGGSAFGVAAPALADDAQPLPIAEPAVPSQNNADAVAEAKIGKLSVDPAGRLIEIKQKGDAAVAKRQRSLADLTAKLAAQTSDCGSNAAMSAEVATTSGALNTVQTNLSAATDLNVAKTLYRSIFIDYRVYLVVSPKAGKVIRCDAQLQRNAALTAEGTKLQGSIDASKLKGADTSVSQAAKDAAMAQLAAINPPAAIAGVLSLVPDKGDKAVQAANAAALKNADSLLDANYAAQKRVNEQFNVARKALNSSAKVQREVVRDQKKAENAAERAARKKK